ncbi:hypothetical protein ACJ73_01815 [Blastomyces percursus]|uniref:Uncharacterized protein n=1 Tax=Blastomyces percursus TaxID=1658174 RepID=A0A1J9RFL7_9EURO|nr:hypothetical protein ACJ73_01815 [Blastomyces percursus]
MGSPCKVSSCMTPYSILSKISPSSREKEKAALPSKGARRVRLLSIGVFGYLAELNGQSRSRIPTQRNRARAMTVGFGVK